MGGSLLWKLLGINILVIVFVILIVWLAVDYLAAGYFVTLMEKYHISPTSSHQMFVSSVHRYLIWASLAAIFLAVVFSFLLVKRVLGPLTRMTSIAREIASGDFTGRAPIATRDEVGQLSVAFNRMTESLQHIEQLRKTMMINVAHELKTPLTNMQGYLEALIDGVVTPSRETFELLQEETMRLVHLVEDILLLAKAEAARTDLHPTEIRIADLIAQALDSFRPQFKTKNITVECQFLEGNDRFQADPDKLSQVVSNLLQNAWQYTPPGGSFRIFMESHPGELRVVFANTGGELAEKDLPFLFERFYRGEKSRSREHGGAGIGLAIVKELIEAHGGRVGAEMSHDEVRIWFALPF
ncbi:MAG TPA: ATP-binding protein [Thermodesulfobacteriota bacterium]|nr:ATP-binding protein [Thermodesulfobacteriota bacterium]